MNARSLKTKIITKQNDGGPSDNAINNKIFNIL